MRNTKEIIHKLVRTYPLCDHPDPIHRVLQFRQNLSTLGILERRFGNR